MVKTSHKNNELDYKSFMRYTTLFVEKKISTFIVFESAALLLLILTLCGFFGLFLIALLFALFGGLYLLLTNFTVNKATNKVLKQSPDFLKISNDYTFLEDKIQIETNLKKKTTVKEISYQDLLFIRENKNFFYLYVTRKLAFIISKSRMKEDEIKELRSIFLSNLDAKRLKLKNK